jgi:hypothetical protein
MALPALFLLRFPEIMARADYPADLEGVAFEIEVQASAAHVYDNPAWATFAKNLIGVS